MEVPPRFSAQSAFAGSQDGSSSESDDTGYADGYDDSGEYDDENGDDQDDNTFRRRATGAEELYEYPQDEEPVNLTSSRQKYVYAREIIQLLQRMPQATSLPIPRSISSPNSNNGLLPSQPITASLPASTAAPVPTTGFCKAKGCRKDEFPFGYKGLAPPPMCPSGQFCPDAEDACQPLIPIGSVCELNRDGECG